jgi:AhpC/TSA antioxidant enzyme
VQLHRELPQIRKSGAELHFVGNGNRHFAQAFKEEMKIVCPLYVDTKRQAYRALEMKRGLASTIGSLAAWKNIARAMKAGFRQGTTQGDAWQLGGVLLVLPGGIVTFRYLSKAAGDHPPVGEVLNALPRR